VENILLWVVDILPKVEYNERTDI